MSAARKPDLRDCAIYRPDSRDGSKSFYISRSVAISLYHQNHIHMDATNGGYCPNPASRYDVRQHRVG